MASLQSCHLKSDQEVLNPLITGQSALEGRNRLYVRNNIVQCTVIAVLGLDKSAKDLDTRDRDRPVYPSFVQANEKMYMKNLQGHWFMMCILC